ncbi:MAG: hypothetical protein WA160_10185 [Pseudobdellovibrio sp.]
MQISKTLKQERISGEIEIREGALTEGGSPMSQSVSVILSILQNGKKLGDLQVVKRTSAIKHELVSALDLGSGFFHFILGSFPLTIF